MNRQRAFSPTTTDARRWAKRLISVRTIVLVTEKCSECGTFLDHERSCPKCSEGAPAEVLPRVVCAWCSVELRAGPPPTSHGICAKCSGAL